jgi:hypothetical protein
MFNNDYPAPDLALFKKKSFVSAAGIYLTWKIECDAMTDEDWQTIADICGPQLVPFNSVYGVPTGGEKLARAFEKYKTPFSTTVLFVDDVWTTGKSMKDAIDKHDPRAANIRGFVAFARNQKLPFWVDCWMHTKW